MVMMAVMFDVGPVRVTGTVRANRARIVWDEGTLYVVTSPFKVRAYSTPEPEQNGDGWNADGFHFTRKGCPTCGYTLSGITVERVKAHAEWVE